MKNCKGASVIGFLRFVKALILGTVFSFVLTMNVNAHASEIVLAWNSSNESNVAGYRVYYGSSVSNLNYRINVNDATSCVISGLEGGETYYFVATAFSDSGNESAFSNMVSKHIASENDGGYVAPEDGTTDGFVQNLSLAEFMYSDDAFGDSSNGAYAQGLIDRGILKIELGGMDSSDISDGISGGWTGEFNVPDSGYVKIDVTYRLITSEYDDDECGRALVAVDGVIAGVNGEKYLDQICGNGDSDWRHERLRVHLSKGWHTLSVGGYNNQKTSLLETTEVFFEKIEVIQ